MEENTIIEVKSLYKSFGKNQVLKDFSLSLKEEENLVILGKSGSGKSVLIKCIIRLIEPDAGEIRVLGQDIAELDQDQMDLLRKDVGFLFQSNALYDSMTVRQNLEFPLRRHWTAEERQKNAESAVLEALEDVQDMMTTSDWFNERVQAVRQALEEPPKWVHLLTDEKEDIRNAVDYNQFMSAEEYACKVQDATEAKLKELNHD